MNEKELNQIRDARLVNMSEHLLYPMLEEDISRIINQACSRFRAGEKDFQNEIAQITHIQDMLIRLKQIQQKGNHALSKGEFHGNTDSASDADNIIR